ncbi:MAG: GAF domain-containing sensor histidine kinase [Anaerolineaceae bacterium]|nr:GAF domain-containing sensor histidine kinase [Anaerolineaceae bacterium]
MRNADSPYLTDWFAISLRWLILFGLTISLGIGGALVTEGNQPDLGKISILCLPALWNGLMSAMAINNRRFPWHRQINLILDTVFSIILFATAGGLRSEISWVGLLPVFTSAVYFEAHGALPAAIVITVLQTGYTYLGDRTQFQPVASGMVAGFNLMAGTLVAFLSAPLVGTLRQTYQRSVKKKKEGELKVQRVERDRMKTLFELIETLSSTLNYQTVLETVLAAAIDAVDEKKADTGQMVGAVLLFGNRNDLEIHASLGFISHDSMIHLPAERGILSEVLKSGETQVILKPGDDPELSKLATIQERGVAICIPLIRSMNAYGVILFAHNTLDFFNTERIESLQMLGNQAVISLQNARLYQDLAQEKERIIQTQEEAQKKLARSLHDGPTQSVSSIAMRLSIARKMMEKSPADAQVELGKIEDLARRTTHEIRHMLFTLRPLILESEGLVPALNTMAEKMHDLYQQKVSVDAAEEVAAQLDMPQQTTIFFLAEEAVNNARKHARAAEILVRLKTLPKDPCTAFLDIIDNGVGFDVEAVMNSYDRRGSLGMINLRERTDLINGALNIESVPGRGTRIRILIPLNEEAADRLHDNKQLA